MDTNRQKDKWLEQYWGMEEHSFYTTRVANEIVKIRQTQTRRPHGNNMTSIYGRLLRDPIRAPAKTATDYNFQDYQTLPCIISGIWEHPSTTLFLDSIIRYIAAVRTCMRECVYMYWLHTLYVLTFTHWVGICIPQTGPETNHSRYSDVISGITRVSTFIARVTATSAGQLAILDHIRALRTRGRNDDCCNRDRTMAPSARHIRDRHGITTPTQAG
jgi:hypothetical protein